MVPGHVPMRSCRSRARPGDVSRPIMSSTRGRRIWFRICDIALRGIGEGRGTVRGQGTGWAGGLRYIFRGPVQRLRYHWYRSGSVHKGLWTKKWLPTLWPDLSECQSSLVYYSSLSASWPLPNAFAAKCFGRRDASAGVTSTKGVSNCILKKVADAVLNCDKLYLQ